MPKEKFNFFEIFLKSRNFDDLWRYAFVFMLTEPFLMLTEPFLNAIIGWSTLGYFSEVILL